MGAGTEVETDTAFMEYISRGRKTIRRKPLLPQHFIDRRHCLTGQEFRQRIRPFIIYSPG